MSHSGRTGRTRSAALLIGAATLLAAIGIDQTSGSTTPAVPAFPGAEGFGTKTPGGRGGRVVRVTNLNDSGPGSLRAALEGSGRRIVVFRVSGTIQLDDEIDITEPYLTVLGQTAPGGGITLRSNPKTNSSGLVDIKTHDVVIRFIRFRSGRYDGSSEGKALDVAKKEAYNVVLDHNSFSWSVDENLTTYDYAHDITISWNIISEALRNAGHPEGSHSRGLFMSGEGNTRRQSAHHNLLAHNDRRNPEINLTGTADVVNNVVYNWGEKAGMVSDKNLGLPLNFVGNYYKPGRDSDDGYELEIYHRDDKCHDTLDLYMNGNIGPNRTDDSAPQKRIVEPDPCVAFRSSPHPAPPVTTFSAKGAYTEVLAAAGAVFPHRDKVDRRIVDDVRDGTGRIIDDPSDVGGWPSLPSEAPPADSDRDGMPDAWETQAGLDPSADDSSADRDGDGYTNIEEYANALVADLTVGADGPVTSQKSPRLRRGRARVRIQQIVFHPRGSGRTNRRLNFERVRLEHRGKHPINIKGWVVRDRRGHRYVFDRKILRPGKVVVIHTGRGSDGGRHRYWGRLRFVWNNDGDGAALKNHRGRVIDRCRYRGTGRRARC